jgi:hypothetical protein
MLSYLSYFLSTEALPETSMDRHMSGAVVRITLLDYKKCTSSRNEPVCTFTREEKFNKQQY